LAQTTVKAFQKGVAAGNSIAALVLEYGFKPVLPEDMDYLALPPDPERSRRYEQIGKFLDRYDGQNPKLPDIDKIVPLPPAKLPPWDGTFQWQKEQEAAEPPPKPSDELILRLCKAKNLDPATGLAIPPPPKAALGTQAKPPYITQSRPIPTPISALARLGCAACCSTLNLQGNAEARLGLRLRNNNRETRSTPWVSAPFFSLF
jgi:hypothetical protein